MPREVYLNGRFVHERDARLSIYDSGVLMGDMAFEVTRTIRGRAFRLREHLGRLWHSLSVMRIAPPLTIDELERATLDTLERNLLTESADDDWNIIHNVSRGPSSAFADAFEPLELRPTVIVSCFPLAPKMAEFAPNYTTGLDAVIPPQLAIPSSIVDASLKTRSRWHYQNANLQADAIHPRATAVLVDTDGHLTEGTCGNVFVVRDGGLETHVARNLLAGITRTLVMELASRLGIPNREVDITRADALAADEMFMTSTSIGIAHVRSFEGRALGDGSLGPVTARLRAALHAELGLDLAAQAEFYARRAATRRERG